MQGGCDFCPDREIASFLPLTVINLLIDMALAESVFRVVGRQG